MAKRTNGSALRQRLLSLTRLGALTDRLRVSLWFIPGLGVLGAVVLAHVLSYLDDTDLLGTHAWFLFGGQAAAARDLLSTFASSIISLAGVVFSISVLILQLASSQFSPRVLRTFLGDRKTQAAMGLFLGSFAYTVVLMSKIRESHGDRDEFVPALAVFVAYVIVLASVLVFVDYIHHMAHSIRAVNIIGRIATETHQSMDRLYPEEAAYEPDRPLEALQSAPDLTCDSGSQSGVLTAIDEDGLLAIACEHDAVLALRSWVGDFVPPRAVLVQVWGSRDVDLERLRECVAIADERTPQQDPAFGFRQLVDIAERALSPGINDPTTAVQVLDRLHALLRELAPRTIPSSRRVDEQHRLRLILPRPDWNSYVRLAFDEIRQYGKSSIQIARRLRGILTDLQDVAPPDRRPVLDEQLALLDAGLVTAFEAEPDRRAAREPSAQGHGPR